MDFAGDSTPARAMRELSVLIGLVIFLCDAPTCNLLPRQ
jgi:hypothetical protein